jgi:hypothetical protein
MHGLQLLHARNKPTELIIAQGRPFRGISVAGYLLDIGSD